MVSTESWVVDRLLGLDCVSGCEVRSSSLLNVERDKLPSVEIGVARLPVVDVSAVQGLLQRHGSISFLLNVPKAAKWDGAAIGALKSARVAFGGLADCYRALRELDVRDYVNPETRYVERILAQHSRVESFERLDDKRYRTVRRGLSDVTAYIVNDYEITAEDVREALGQYDSFEVYVSSNPNNHGVAESTAAALRDAGVDVMIWSDFMSGLHREWK